MDSLTDTSRFVRSLTIAPVGAQDSGQMSAFSPSHSLFGRDWRVRQEGVVGDLTLVYVWGQLLAELLHYPVAIAANCNFPPVLGKITTQLQVGPMARVRHLRWDLPSPACQARSPQPYHSALSPSDGQNELQFRV